MNCSRWNYSIWIVPYWNHIAIDIRNFEVATLLLNCYQIEIYQIWLVNFSIRKGLSLALSAEKPISFDKRNYLVTHLNSIHRETWAFFSYLQKMNWFLPLNDCLAPTFFYLHLADLWELWVLSGWESQLRKGNRGE